MNVEEEERLGRQRCVAVVLRRSGAASKAARRLGRRATVVETENGGQGARILAQQRVVRRRGGTLGGTVATDWRCCDWGDHRRKHSEVVHGGRCSLI